MNPIYKFELTAGNTTQQAFPIYKDDLAKDFEKESNQEFFRAKLSGKLTFESDDYTFIVSKRKSKGKICFNYLCCCYAICLFAVIVCYNNI